MFNKNEFSIILQKINATYDTMTEFAKKADFDRTYISKYINMKLDNAPTPKILAKIANASKGLVSYDELMTICGYIDENNLDTYLLAMLGLTEKDLTEFTTRLNQIALSEHENVIFSNMIDKMRNAIVHLDKSFKLDIDKYLENEGPESQEKIISAMRLYHEYLKKIVEFANTASKTNNNNNNNDDDDDNQENNKIVDNRTLFYNCPVYGRISAGIPNWAEECLESYLPLDPNLMNINNPEECFFLRVNGESMNKLVRNGAYALIRKQDVVENGDIAVVLVDNYDATLKKFTKHGDVVVLEPMSNDPNFQTQIYDKNTDIKILGKYLGKFELN